MDGLSGSVVVVEPLECRQMLSAAHPAVQGAHLAVSSIPTNINVSQLNDNEAEGATAIDPADPSHLFVVSNTDKLDGMFCSVSLDGGATWSERFIADGHDNLPIANSDPSAVYDEFGNLFLSYLNLNTDNLTVAVSSDGGANFRTIGILGSTPDQPTITAAKGMLWVTYAEGSSLVARAAAVVGLDTISHFGRAAVIPRASDASFGDIAIGPRGQVMVTFLSPAGEATNGIYVSVDSDGLGPGGFNRPVLVTTNTVALNPPVQKARSIDAEPGLAYDRSGGLANGRVYLIYTVSGRRASNTEIYLRYSNDNGVTWTKALRVNDDATSNSQILPRIAVDPTTGYVAMSWYDARNDAGTHSSGDTNGVANDDVQFWGTVAAPGRKGIALSTNFQISAGTTNATPADDAIDLGDYTGLAFQSGLMFPVWSDNSNTTGDNPGGVLDVLNLYVALIRPNLIF